MKSKCKFGIKLNIQNADEISLIIKHKSGQCKFVWLSNTLLAYGKWNKQSV